MVDTSPDEFVASGLVTASDCDERSAQQPARVAQVDASLRHHGVSAASTTLERSQSGDLPFTVSHLGAERAITT